MQLSMRCSVAVHCLIFICTYAPRIRVTSALLAQSTGCHPVVVRNILSALKKAGILSVARGTGGARIARPPEEITLLDIYTALEPEGVGELIGIHSCQGRPCPVARNIAGVLESPYRQIEASARAAMASVTLRSMLQDYAARLEKEQLFRTERLGVRPLDPVDADALFPILSDPAVMRYLEPPFTRPQTEAFIRDCGLCDPPRVYGVEEKASAALIGHLIFHPFEGAGCYELGWVLARERWGKGYASELTEGAVRYAEKLGIGRLVMECLPENAATIRVAEKCGFRPDGEAEGLLRFVRIL